jgi:hypothetical protein
MLPAANETIRLGFSVSDDCFLLNFGGILNLAEVRIYQSDCGVLATLYSRLLAAVQILDVTDRVSILIGSATSCFFFEHCKNECPSISNFFSNPV